ncbi:MAG: helix-turn-helix transcriptional regulator, partial [Ignavibacteria bacterium]|nr:helix-turn-helix transcriptional regulator [Ignavibacteria bacterium]
MQKSNINTFDCKKYIRDQIKQARIEANDSQEDLALALGKSRVTISDLERGRVEINAQDLLGIAIYYSKPIGYFFPRELTIDKEELSPLEQELLLL